MKKVAIIGGGPSGIMCALTIKKQIKDVSVDIYEKQNRIGKKIIVSGNGKCNITNLSQLDDNIYNNDFARQIYNIYKPQDFIIDLHNMGLLTTVDSSKRVYPLSEASHTVMDLFLKELEKLNVSIYVSTNVDSILKKNNKYIINTLKSYKEYDFVVVAGGSIASLNDKQTENYHNYLDKLGLQITKLSSGLVGLKTTKDTVKGLNGIRQKGVVSLYDEKSNKVFEERGEIQFKEDGISGIVIMNASSIIARSNQKLKMEIDFLADYSKKHLLSLLPCEKSLEDSTSGILHKMLNKRIIDTIKTKDLESFIDMAKAYPINVISSYSFEKAQVTVGGIKTEQLNLDMSLKKDANIYICGEILDIDGLCGGYNMHFAFASGKIAGDSIANKLKQ